MTASDALKELLGPDTAHDIDLMLWNHKGSWDDAVHFVKWAIASYIERDRPDYIGPSMTPLPSSWPWPPDPDNPEHATYYDFAARPLADSADPG